MAAKAAEGNRKVKWRVEQEIVRGIGDCLIFRLLFMHVQLTLPRQH